MTCGQSWSSGKRQHCDGLSRHHCLAGVTTAENEHQPAACRRNSFQAVLQVIRNWKDERHMSPQMASASDVRATQRMGSWAAASPLATRSKPQRLCSNAYLIRQFEDSFVNAFASL
jgi:hypothetical protein